MMDAQAELYKEEAFELLAELERSLLDVEQTPDDEDLIAGIFRSLHTIKGSGAMFGFDEVASFAHDIETVYDGVRNHTLAVDKSLVDLTLAACDILRKMVEGKEVDPRLVEAKTADFRAFLPADIPKSKEAAAKKTAETPEEGVEGPLAIYRIRFEPETDLFIRGTNPTLLLAELRSLGKCVVLAQTERIPPLDSFDPESCYTYWDILLTTTRETNAIRDVFIFVEDESRIFIDVIDDGTKKDLPDDKKLGEILVDRGYADQETIARALEGRKKIGELLMESAAVAPNKIEAALAEQQSVRDAREKRRHADAAATIRVPAGRLDLLVNLVGEMVTVQSRLSQLSCLINHPDLAVVAEDFERLVAELRDNTMNIRMLPIGNTFNTFQRLVRDLSVELGKEISLVTEGEDTELDKTVIEQLADPLVHLIRNSIDHGIEPPDQRLLRNKPKQGVIKLSAEHAGAHVLISVSDDGAGLDSEAIRIKAVERGLLRPEDRPGAKDLYSLIFAPGFSLAPKVTSVSGRGVGMDVVKRSIEALGGVIDIDSVKDEGTTILLKLPLTLAIIDGLLVKIADAFFILPLCAIEECVELSREEIRKMSGKSMTVIRGEPVPYIALRERFGLSGQRPAIEQIIVNRIGNERIGLVVDQVIGQHQTVIKNMGRFYRHVKEISGATILGDGAVALILDVPQLAARTADNAA